MIIYKTDIHRDLKGRFATVNTGEALHHVTKFIMSEAFKKDMAKKEDATRDPLINTLSKDYEAEAPKKVYPTDIKDGISIHHDKAAQYVRQERGDADVHHMRGLVEHGTGLQYHLNSDGSPVDKDSYTYLRSTLHSTAKLAHVDHVKHSIDKVLPLLAQHLKRQGVPEAQASAAIHHLKGVLQDVGLASSVLGNDATYIPTVDAKGNEQHIITVHNKKAITRHSDTKKEDMSGADLNTAGLKNPTLGFGKKPRSINVRGAMTMLNPRKVQRIRNT